MVKIIFILTTLIPLLASAIDDKKLLNDARTAFATGKMQKAIDLYTQITPQSDFWLESIEERAWSWTRIGEFENALADLQSITSPVWRTQIGPESYMLSAFVSLKMCNSKEVLAKLNMFKKRMMARVDGLENILAQPLSKEFLKLAPAIKNSQLNMIQLGNQAEMFPRYFFRDKQLIDALKEGQNETAANRLKDLAQTDLQEIRTNLKKMKIIEVEMMQTVLMTAPPKKSADLNFSQVDRNEKLIFPVTDDEVWTDEVGQYQVRAQKCPSNQKSAL